MQVTIARQLGLEPTTVGNFFMNDQNPVAPMLKATLDATPKFKHYAENVIMKEFTYLKTRGPQPPFWSHLFEAFSEKIDQYTNQCRVLS